MTKRMKENLEKGGRPVVEQDKGALSKRPSMHTQDSHDRIPVLASMQTSSPRFNSFPFYSKVMKTCKKAAERLLSKTGSCGAYTSPTEKQCAASSNRPSRYAALPAGNKSTRLLSESSRTGAHCGHAGTIRSVKNRIWSFDPNERHFLSKACAASSNRPSRYAALPEKRVTSFGTVR